eukprot:148296_1
MANEQNVITPLTRTNTLNNIKNNYGSLNAKSIENTKNSFRWWVFSACSFVMFSTWYAYFVPTALQTQFMEIYNLSDNDYALIFTISLGPTCLIPIFSGIIIDKTGIGLSVIISTIIMVIAQIIFFIYCIINPYSLTLLFISRCILGIGTSWWQIGFNTMLAKYFIGKELAFALSFSPAMSRIGFAAADFISYKIYFLTGKYTLIWSVLLTVIALILCCIYIIIITIIHWKLQKSTVEIPYGMRKKTFSQSFIKIGYDIKQTPISLWIIVIIAGLGYIPFTCWTVIGSELLQSIYGYNEQFADNLLLIPCFSTVIAAPLTGMFIDHYGRLSYVLIISSGLYLIFHLYILCGYYNVISYDNEIIIIILIIFLGIAFSMFATSLWSSIALIVDSSIIGISNGLACMTYAFGVAIGQLIVGKLTDDNNYYFVQMFFVYISFGMLIVSTILMFHDYNKGKRLYLPTH